MGSKQDSVPPAGQNQTLQTHAFHKACRVHDGIIWVLKDRSIYLSSSSTFNIHNFSFDLDGRISFGYYTKYFFNHVSVEDIGNVAKDI